MRIISMPDHLELKCSACAEGIVMSSPDGVPLLSLCSFIVDHADCKPVDELELTPIGALNHVLDLANQIGVTDNQSQNGGLL